MRIYNKNEIDELAEILKNDGVICVPTDTVYGVCACVNSVQAKDKLNRLKNRPSNKLLPIMCSDIEQLKEIAIVDERVEKLINEFMPGPLTLILRKKPGILEFNNDILTIGVRLATSEVLKELIKKAESPLFMSSANRSGQPPCKNFNEIKESLPDLDGILEGEVTFGQASTIVDCTLEKIKILRQGPISEEQIMEVLKV